MPEPTPSYENWDARNTPAWVACPRCSERVEMPIEGPPNNRTWENRQRFVALIVMPFAQRLGDQCQYAETMRHSPVASVTSTYAPSVISEEGE